MSLCASSCSKKPTPAVKKAIKKTFISEPLEKLISYPPENKIANAKEIINPAINRSLISNWENFIMA